MPEVYSWPEGRALAWTGAASPAIISYTQGTRVLLSYGKDIHESIDGVYAEHLTGQRADVSITAMYTYDMTIHRLSQTAMHIQLDHNGINGSAGYLLYSGYVDSIVNVGGPDNPYMFALAYHAFIFSAYGG